MTTTMEQLEDRLAELEARAGIGVTPLAANPPITVGELTDVPAPGSQIASVWAQEVSNRIVHRFANKAALDAWAAANGSQAVLLDTHQQFERRAGIWAPLVTALSNYGNVAFPDLAAAGTGIKNVATIAAGLTLPYPVNVVSIVALEVGFGSTQINFSVDVFKTFGAAPVAIFPGPIAAAAGAYVPMPMLAQWPVPAGQDIGYTVRINVSAMASGVVHTAGYAQTLWIAT